MSWLSDIYRREISFGYVKTAATSEPWIVRQFTIEIISVRYMYR